jgi:sugar transferase (PEP-CTERM/EpsH1 system associated)
MPIRIMHVVNSLGKGGLENGLVNLIRGMDAQKFEHVVCTLRGLGPNVERLPSDRVKVVALDVRGWSARVQTPALVRAIRAVQPDIVHSRNWSAIEAVFAARLAGVGGIVHSEHGFEADSSAPEPWRRRLFRRSAFELAHRVLSVSWQLRDVHARRTGFPVDKIGVIYNGVDAVRFSPDPATRVRIRAELGIVERELCVGCVANLLPVKDHMTLLEAIAAHASISRDWRLILVGDGPERARLEAYVDARPAWKPQVLFLGSSSRVPDLLRAMDVFVLPSIAEGMCNSLLEAMASGVAVVASSVGGNPEVVVDGSSGLLFPPGDVPALARHLAHLGAHPDIRAELAANGVSRVRKEFSVESMVQAYEHMYRSVRPAKGAPVLSPGYH